MKRASSGIPALLLLALFLTACAARSGEDVAAQPLSMFADVPLAPELSLDEKESHVYDHPIGQVGLLKASGAIQEKELLDFYRPALAANGWLPCGEFETGGGRLLVFGKPPRSLAIIIKEGWINSQVEINVSAKK